MYKEKLRESFKVYDEIVLKCFCGIFIGAIVAICEVIFGKRVIGFHVVWLHLW